MEDLPIIEQSLYKVIEAWLEDDKTKEYMAEEGLEDYSDLPHQMTDWAMKAMRVQNQ